jgi:hypothetical protein
MKLLIAAAKKGIDESAGEVEANQDKMAVAY